MAESSNRTELDKLIRLLRWIVIGAVVVFAFPYAAEFVAMLVGALFAK